MVQISVIIPTYNRKNQLKNCLEKLFQQNYSVDDFEILVCDDGSTDGTEKIIKSRLRKQPNLRYLKQMHGGVFWARNLGIKSARGAIIAFTDDDCLPKKTWLAEIDKAFRTNPKILGVEGKTITFPNRVTPFTNQIVNTHGGSYQTCNIAYKKEILEKLGGFDARFLYPHCEDMDLALRTLQHGTILFEPKVSVVHPPSPTTATKELNRILHIYSELYLFLKHPDYFRQKYGPKNIFSQVIFINSIWIRLFHLKLHFRWWKKNPLLYLKFVLLVFSEIILTILFTPKFWYFYTKSKQSRDQKA